MPKALFLDRDGVLTELVYHEDFEEWEAPRDAGEVRLLPGVREAVQRAADAGWMIFVVSNQPDAAKGKTRFGSLDAAHKRVVQLLEGAPITEFFYCFHRAEDRCSCRKPQPTLVLEAAKRHSIDLGQSWFAGDVDTDIECGRWAGCRTALLEYEHSSSRRGKQRADLVSRDLGHFVSELLMRESNHAAETED